MFKLDKTSFRKGKISEQDNFVDYWMNKTPLERLEASWFLICNVHGIDINNQPKMRKDIYSKGKIGDS